jgi:peptidoglycan hydrolase-like protein with peptidoglycan-binding domain
MRPIVAEIGPRSHAEDVGNLQNALLFLLERGLVRLFDDEQEALLRDREARVYSEGTGWAVIAFHEQFGLELGEIVGEPTAEALNRLLERLGVFDAGPQDVRHMAG